MSARSEANCTSFNRSSRPLCSRLCSSSRLRSKWSSTARLPRPVMIKMSVRPARTASSTTYWIAGLSTTGSISLGELFVAGKKRVPRPAAGMTALRTPFPCTSRPPCTKIELLTTKEPPDVLGVAGNDQQGEAGDDDLLPASVTGKRDSNGKRERREQRRERRLVQRAATTSHVAATPRVISG